MLDLELRVTQVEQDALPETYKVQAELGYASVQATGGHPITEPLAFLTLLIPTEYLLREVFAPSGAHLVPGDLIRVRIGDDDHAG